MAELDRADPVDDEYHVSGCHRDERRIRQAGRGGASKETELELGDQVDKTRAGVVGEDVAHAMRRYQGDVRGWLGTLGFDGKRPIPILAAVGQQPDRAWT